MPLENPLSNEPGNASSVHSHDDYRDNLLTQQLEARNSCRVLVVDDDALVCARLSALLNASQYDVEVATTGEEALRVLDATHCHIVLTDWQMPHMDGLALCRHIRLRHHEDYIYVLMLTIRDSEHDVMRGFAAGADAYVTKGAALNDILARLEIGRRITCDRSSMLARRQGTRGVSHTDPVTGAYNFGYLLEHLPRELARSQRHGHALAILHCSIDGFDRFGDPGDETGNELLRTFVAGADGQIRQGDWLVRTAGDAFMIVLPETTAKGAHCAAQKLRRLFAVNPRSTPAEPLGFTVSIGVTAVDAKHDTESAAKIEAVLRAADRGRYADAGTLADMRGIGAQIGGKSGLN
jgi:two-component system cell cycle response regulator